MTCIPAPACKAALAEASRLWPNRRKTSDGICASPEHIRRSPVSDHNTGDAWDLSHDPGAGCDCHAIVARIIERRDPRVSYVIWDRTIWRSYPKPGLPAWMAERYTGSNSHTLHCHISIKSTARNDTSPWFTQDEEDDLTPEEREALFEVRDFVRASRASVGAMDANADGRMEHIIESVNVHTDMVVAHAVNQITNDDA